MTRIKRDGHIRILRGNLAPEGAVAKITGKEGTRFVGIARVFDSEEDMLHGLEAGQDRRRATSSSSAMKAPRAAPACRRCSRPPAPWPATACSTTSP